MPARRVRPRQLVEIQATKPQIVLHSTVPDASGETLLSAPARAVGRGAVVKQDERWDGLPTGENRRTTTGDGPPPPRRVPASGPHVGALLALLNRSETTRSRSQTSLVGL
ncbi:hypothetical protein ABT317_26925 [Streptomyces carpinensis]|uniref:Uncharacterized protein n=1 Tax=Streptomyces carpinensis TaxID=66369 RepID=A0ABV1W8I0_9ACTN